MKAASVSGGTTTSPSGLREAEATLATTFPTATPMLAVRWTSLRIMNLIWRAMSSGVVVPCRVRAVTSMYASSSASPSIFSGAAKRRKMAWTARLASR